MTEPQYAHYNTLPREYLGLMANEIWQRDPKLLGIHLARYKFVAKMLSGKQRVAEIGCGDAFYSRVVEQGVGSLWVYDFDPNMIKDLFSRQKDNWTLNGGLHNILDSPLEEGPFDAIYSLDVMEHIPLEHEETYLRNIKHSLIDDGVFIVGMPSLESQQYASPASKAGHVNCKTGSDLKSALEKHFKNVFLFSMSDEVIHTGFYPMAHYLMALCVGVQS